MAFRLFTAPVLFACTCLCSYCEIPVRHFLVSNVILALHFLDDPTVLLGGKHWAGHRKSLRLRFPLPFNRYGFHWFLFCLAGIRAVLWVLLRYTGLEQLIAATARSKRYHIFLSINSATILHHSKHDRL